MAQGLGKRVPVREFRLQGRLGTGKTAVKLRAADSVAAALLVGTEASAGSAAAAAGGSGQDVLVSTAQGLLVRLPLDAIPIKRRTNMGQILVKPGEGDEAVQVTLVGAETPIV